MFWFSFDWDFVTGEHYNVRRNIARVEALHNNERYLKGYGPMEVAEEVERIRGKRLELVYALIQRVSIQRVVFRDEHHTILNYLKKGDRVWDIDAHCDCYGDRHPYWIDCGNWMTHAINRGVSVRSLSSGKKESYRHHEDVPEDLFTHIRPPKKGCLFVCLSADYTVPTWDDVLFTFLSGFSSVDFDLGEQRNQNVRKQYEKLRPFIPIKSKTPRREPLLSN